MPSAYEGTGDISFDMISTAVDAICLRHMKERILYHICSANISYGSAVYHIALAIYHFKSSSQTMCIICRLYDCAAQVPYEHPYYKIPRDTRSPGRVSLVVYRFRFIEQFKFCTDHLAPPLGELSPKATERAVGIINFVQIS